MAGGNLSSSTVSVQQETGKSYLFPFSVVTLLFFMWGFITCMNDILIPYLKGVFDLTFFQAMLVQFAFFSAYFIGSLIYFIISINSGDPITKIGYKNGIIAGLLTSALGCALFFPAAEYKIYGFFLGALFCLGIGFTLLQIAANPYVAILGSASTASSRLNLAQGFNSFGTTIAPILGGYLVFEYFASPHMQGADAVKIPYLVFSALFVLMAVIIKIVHLPTFANTEKIEKGAGALQYPHLVFGMIAIFMYVGGEVTIGSLLINFFEQEHIAGITEEKGKLFLAYYWGGAMIGRFLGSISLSQIEQSKKIIAMFATANVVFLVIFSVSGVSFQEVMPYIGLMVLQIVAFFIGKSLAGRTLAVFSLVNIVLLLFTIFTQGQVAFWAVIGIGLFNSIMWSNIFTLAIDGLGKYTSQGSSLLVMMILGGALIPPIQGALADNVGVQNSFFVPIICYAYLLFYGAIGSKKKNV
jgi:FHS family L-fucose permease-like MFS transporter